MNLRQLRYFIVLAEDLHFGRAAARLGISQPPLSQQIRALETELGASLFERTSRHTRLTDAGRLFLHEARKALDQVERARAVARRAQSGEIGEVSIGITTSVPLTERFHATVRAFRSSYPAVETSLRELPTRRQIEDLAAGDLQIGFLRTAGEPPRTPDSVLAKCIDREELVAVLRHDHPAAMGDPQARIPLALLADDPFVVFSREVGGNTYDQIISFSRAAGFAPRLGQEVREAATLIGLVAAGTGVTLMAASFRRILIDGLVVRHLELPAPTAATWLAHNVERLSPLTRAFLSIADSPHSTGSPPASSS